MSRFGRLAPRNVVTISITPALSVMHPTDAKVSRPDLEGAELGVNELEVIVERARQGEAAARAAIYHRFAREVSNLALRLVRDRTEAADILQDTFVEAFERLSALREPSKVGGWLRTITVRQAQRRFRRRKLRRMLGWVPIDEVPLEQLAKSNADQETILELRRVDRALSTLDARERTVWTLRFLEQETLPMIASLCGISLATVKRDLARASAQVQAVVEAP